MEIALYGVTEKAADQLREAFEELEAAGCSGIYMSFYVDDSDNLRGSYSVICDGTELTNGHGVPLRGWMAATAIDQRALAERHLAEDLNLKMCLLAQSLTP